MTTTADPAPVCPECAVGKHRNCDGTALDDTTDQIVHCACSDADHNPQE